MGYLWAKYSGLDMPSAVFPIIFPLPRKKRLGNVTLLDSLAESNDWCPVWTCHLIIMLLFIKSLDFIQQRRKTQIIWRNHIFWLINMTSSCIANLVNQHHGWLKNQLKIWVPTTWRISSYVDARVSWKRRDHSFMFLDHQVRPRLDTGHCPLLLLFLTLSQVVQLDKNESAHQLILGEHIIGHRYIICGNTCHFCWDTHDEFDELCTWFTYIYIHLRPTYDWIPDTLWLVDFRWESSAGWLVVG